MKDLRISNISWNVFPSRDISMILSEFFKISNIVILVLLLNFRRGFIYNGQLSIA